MRACIYSYINLHTCSTYIRNHVYMYLSIQGYTVNSVVQYLTLWIANFIRLIRAPIVPYNTALVW